MIRTTWCLLVAALCGCASAPPSSGLLPTPSTAETVLVPGDGLRVTVWRAPELSGEFVIGPDSALIHPLYQGVKVAGVRRSVVTQRLAQLLGRYQQDPLLVIEPLFAIAVGGEVRTPNLYVLPSGTTITQAIARAGGPSDRALLTSVRLVRGRQAVTLDLTRYAVQPGAMPVASGDQIIVGRRSDFNLFRDVLLPVTSLAVAGVYIADILSQHR